MRLDKYIASCTGMTRKDVKKALKKSPAFVAGEKVSAPETQVDIKTKVVFMGEHLHYSEFTYILMNKAAGYVCTNRAGRNPTVFSLLGDDVKAKELFTVGRLDKDTTGLLLITNDGDFSHRMIHAKKHVDKTYYLTVDTPIPVEAVEKFKIGVDIGDDEPTKPATLEILTETSANLTICEGRFHQVKRMMETVGCTVTSLKRLSVGPFTLDESLAEGEYRFFNDREMEFVKKGSPDFRTPNVHFLP
ncbi:MAG TPA: 16S rRNA pseudouridine(516) synthase [Lachnospiraceae bacterium]|nr:16S rRNA pseudouridine(516) synthase [Lachnospiraceae bacterium]